MRPVPPTAHLSVFDAISLFAGLASEAMHGLEAKRPHFGGACYTPTQYKPTQYPPRNTHMWPGMTWRNASEENPPTPALKRDYGYELQALLKNTDPTAKRSRTGMVAQVSVPNMGQGIRTA